MCALPATNEVPNPAERLPLERVLLPDSFANEPGPIDWRALFGRGGLVEVEIGSGKGTFLVARARARRDVSFLGIEWARAFCVHAADRMARWGLDNVRLLRADAEKLFHQRIPDGSLSRVHIYFPDPWPKTKHKRRRIIKPPFVSLLRRKLRVGGILALATDHMDYARQMDWVVHSEKGFARIPFPRSQAAESGEVVGTNFERKYIAQGRRFYSTAVMKLW